MDMGALKVPGLQKAKKWGPGVSCGVSGYPAAVRSSSGQTDFGVAARNRFPLIGHLCCCMTWAMRSLQPSFKIKVPRCQDVSVMLVVVGLLLEVGNMENIWKSRETIGRIVCWETLLAMKLF